MPTAFVIALSLHMLAATFWAGTTFVLARTGGLGLDRLRAPQLGAALVAVASGGYMGHAMHSGALTRMQLVLLAGAACALLAGALQVVAAVRARGGNQGFNVAAQRAAAALLAVAAVCMVVARYA
jgi:hypothetical protein